MASIVLWRDLDRLAHRAARRFRLGPVVLQPHGHSRARDFGKIEIPERAKGEDGPAVIRLRVHRLGRPSQPLARRTLLETLAHELAHLDTYNHGPAHRARTREILTWMEGAL